MNANQKEIKPASLNLNLCSSERAHSSLDFRPGKLYPSLPLVLTLIHQLISVVGSSWRLIKSSLRSYHMRSSEACKTTTQSPSEPPVTCWPERRESSPVASPPASLGTTSIFPHAVAITFFLRKARGAPGETELVCWVRKSSNNNKQSRCGRWPMTMAAIEHAFDKSRNLATWIGTPRAARTISRGQQRVQASWVGMIVRGGIRD